MELKPIYSKFTNPLVGSGYPEVGWADLWADIDFGAFLCSPGCQTAATAAALAAGPL